jgi:hypothetical protein
VISVAVVVVVVVVLWRLLMETIDMEDWEAQGF